MKSKASRKETGALAGGPLQRLGQELIVLQSLVVWSILEGKKHPKEPCSVHIKVWGLKWIRSTSCTLPGSSAKNCVFSNAHPLETLHTTLTSKFSYLQKDCHLTSVYGPCFFRTLEALWTGPPPPANTSLNTTILTFATGVTTPPGKQGHWVTQQKPCTTSILHPMTSWEAIQPYAHKCCDPSPRSQKPIVQVNLMFGKSNKLAAVCTALYSCTGCRHEDLCCF